MQLSDLMDSRVIDADGNHLGKVRDVRVVQDGPLLLPFGAAFRVEGLAVGSGPSGRRLGYERQGVRGPWLLRVLFGRLSQRDRFVDWRDVTTWNGREVHLRVRAADLSPLDG